MGLSNGSEMAVVGGMGKVWEGEKVKIQVKTCQSGLAVTSAGIYSLVIDHSSLHRPSGVARVVYRSLQPDQVRSDFRSPYQYKKITAVT